MEGVGVEATGDAFAGVFDEASVGFDDAVGEATEEGEAAERAGESGVEEEAAGLGGEETEEDGV